MIVQDVVHLGQNQLGSVVDKLGVFPYEFSAKSFVPAFKHVLRQQGNATKGRQQLVRNGRLPQLKPNSFLLCLNEPAKMGHVQKS